MELTRLEASNVATPQVTVNGTALAVDVPSSKRPYVPKSARPPSPVSRLQPPVSVWIGGMGPGCRVARRTALGKTWYVPPLSQTTVPCRCGLMHLCMACGVTCMQSSLDDEIRGLRRRLRFMQVRARARLRGCPFVSRPRSDCLLLMRMAAPPPSYNVRRRRCPSGRARQGGHLCGSR